MEMIKLKDLLLEQITAPNKRDVKSVTGRQLDDASAALHPTEYKIAKTIYDAKGTFVDDEKSAVQAILSIKNAAQWNLVDKILKTFPSAVAKRGLASYASSIFTSNPLASSPERSESISPDLIKILKHAKQIGADAKSINTLKIYSTPIEYDWSNIDLSGTGLGSPMVHQALSDPEVMHRYLETLSLLTLYFPILSGTFMLMDAALYYKQGDYYNSGLVTIFATLPAIGPIGRLLSKIPGVGTVTAEMMAKIGQKVAAAKTNVKALAKMLNPMETKIIRKLIENKNLVKAELDKYFQRIAQKAPKYIKSIGKKGSAVIRQIANGTITASKVGVKIGTAITKFAARQSPYVAAPFVWNDLFFRLGLDKIEQGSFAREIGTVTTDPDFKAPNIGNFVYKK
jgi:hypothetical protein